MDVSLVPHNKETSLSNFKMAYMTENFLAKYHFQKEDQKLYCDRNSMNN